MSELLPISGTAALDSFLGATKSLRTATAVDLSPSEPLLAKIQSGAVALPKTVRELNRTNTFTYSLSAQAAVELGIPLGSMNVDGSTSVFVQDYAQYRELAEGAQKVLVGVAVRYSIAFRQLGGNFKLSGLPMIAAAVQLNFAQSSARFEVLGMSSPRIAELVPVVSQMDVEAYAKYAEALQAIKALIWDEETSVEPTILAVNGEAR